MSAQKPKADNGNQPKNEKPPRAGIAVGRKNALDAREQRKNGNRALAVQLVAAVRFGPGPKGDPRFAGQDGGGPRIGAQEAFANGMTIEFRATAAATLGASGAIEEMFTGEEAAGTKFGLPEAEEPTTVRRALQDAPIPEGNDDVSDEVPRSSETNGAAAASGSKRYTKKK